MVLDITALASRELPQRRRYTKKDYVRFLEFPVSVNYKLTNACKKDICLYLQTATTVSAIFRKLLQ